MSDVGVVGHSFPYSNGAMRTDEDNYTTGPSPPLVKPVRGLKPAKGTVKVLKRPSFSWIDLVEICILFQ